ncbi:flagellar basal body-associated FliL family protein [Candidatus Ferrigenium straubiae]|mgnify:CR=1 FL=1|jgi:flagellar FliL protein|uniref:flagellar basal body-associated FliL family protein n=1 Tax=Candidatus Ferrigenium straubiae TaxID=2919506 RepID=UPI003F4AC70A
MARAAKPTAQAAEEEEIEASPKKSKKKLILFIVAVVLLAGGGAAAFLLLNPEPAPKRGGAASAESARAEIPPKFVDLGQFTANLMREEDDRYLQIAISLKITKPELEEKIKESKPEILHRVNMLLQSKRPSELATFDGKERLAQQIRAQVEYVVGLRKTAPAISTEQEASPVEPNVGRNGIADVLFTSFIIQ